MSNTLKKMEKELRAFAKRNKDVKYTKGLLLSFLLMGALAFSETLTSPQVKSTENAINQTKKELNTSISDMHRAFKQAKKENNRLLRNANLELIQLMEQGDQVIKMPWNTWQWGMGYTFSDWRGSYKGKGDKKEKYPFSGILERDADEFNRYIPLDSENRDALGRGKSVNSAATNMREGLPRGYGLASTALVKENPITVQVSAGITPRNVNKNSPASTPSAPTIILPAFEPKLVTPPATPATPNTPGINLFNPVDITFQVGGFGQNWNVQFWNTSQGVVAQNYRKYEVPTGTFDITANGSSVSVAGSMTATETGGSTNVLANTSNGIGLNAFISHVNDNDVDVTGNYKFTSNVGRAIFISLNPYQYGKNTANDKTFNFQGTLSLVSNGGSVIGIEHQLLAGGPGGTETVNNVESGQTTSILINSGTIKLESGKNMIGIVIDTEYFSTDNRSYFKKLPKTINDGTIEIGENAKESIGIDYGWYYQHTGLANLKGPNTTVKIGNIIVNGQDSYGYRQKAYNNDYYDDMSTVSSGGGKITLNGKKNVGFAIAQGKSTGDPISNFSAIQLLVGGENNIGFLRTATNNQNAITLDSTKVGDVFNFSADATKSALVRSDKHEVIWDKGSSATPYVLTTAKEKNTFMQAGSTGTVTLNTGKVVKASMKEFYGMTAGDFISSQGAKAVNKGTLEIGGDKSIGMAVAKLNNGESTGTIKYTGTEGTAIYNLGTFKLQGNVEVEGKSSTGIFNSVGTVSINGAENTKIAVKNGATGIYSVGGSVKIDPALSTGKKVEITVDDTSSTDKGVAVYAKGGATVNLKKAEIDVKKGAAGVSVEGTGTTLDLENAKLKYDGSGYAVYVKDGGTVKLKNAEIELRGNGVGFEKDSGSTLDTDNTTKVHIYSNDVTVFNLKNVTGGLSVSGLFNNVSSKVGTINVDDSHGFTDYKLASIDGLDDYKIDKDINKGSLTPANHSNDDYVFTKYLNVQKAKVNLMGKNVTAHLNGTQLNEIGIQTPVGLDMNSSATATNRNQTGITLHNGSTVSADRTDDGAGAVGLFINYGEAKVNSGATVNVEKSGINGENEGAVGIFAVNDSSVDNDGTINVGGKNSIGILGLSYRTDRTGLKINEFRQTTTTHGDIDVKNNSQLNLNGESAVGIYVENNDNTGAAHDVKGENTATGTITMTGTKAVGMAAKKGNITNSGTLNMTGAEQGVGMFGDVSGTLTNNGTISTGDAATESALRIGMFTTNAGVGIVNSGTINAGKNSYGIYGKNVTTNNGSVFNIGENGVGIFSKATQSVPTSTDNITINAGTTFNIGNENAVGVFTENDTDGIQITDNGSTMNIGENSYGYVLKGHNTKFTNVAGGNVSMNKKSVYLYSNDNTANITNNVSLTSTNEQTYGLYSAGTLVNNGNMNFQTGIGNVGMYSINGGTATNNASITVGASDTATNKYAIGMAAGYKNLDYAKVVNNGTINVTGASGIGMYATGNNGSGKSIAENHGTINLAGEGAIGMYLDEGAEGHNYGTIKTTGTQSGMIGVVLSNNSTLVNHAGATININSAGGFGTYRVNTPIDNVTVVNYGDITVSGGAARDGMYDPTGGQDLDKNAGGVRMHARPGQTTPDITLNGVPVPNIDSVNQTHGTRPEALIHRLGMYVDTLRGTNPINGLGALGVQKAELLIGPEAAERVNGKYIEVGENILKPYQDAMRTRRGIEWSINSASLTWMALPILNGYGVPQKVYMAKIPYTAFAGNQPTPVEKTDTYNFTSGLEQRYGVEAIDSREKQLFNKLNKIGKNEEALLYQAFDEMMGHQYANVQHRVSSTSQVLDKEINKLSSQWQNTTKKSSKITTFGARGEYNTDTAGIIDYTNNAFGVAYIHENETIKLGNSSGWYAGAVNNTFKFKDIGKSKENVTMVKAGVYNTKAFDNNGSLQWTISGEAFASRSAMERKYLVVDEIFKAKSDYNTYGVAVKNEISKEFRTGERFSIRPYGSLKLEYGKFGDIKEKSGEMRLEVKGNDYISVKPEVGMEFKYKRAVGRYGTFSTTLGLGYENELGKVDNVKNKARVANTNAEWFGIRSEKDDRKGNFKADLTVGIDNSKFGVTVNGGYDTKGKNVRGGIGFKFMY